MNQKSLDELVLEHRRLAKGYLWRVFCFVLAPFMSVAFFWLVRTGQTPTWPELVLAIVVLFMAVLAFLVVQAPRLRRMRRLILEIRERQNNDEGKGRKGKDRHYP